MGSFKDEHGYSKGTYEGKLSEAGVPESAWGSFGKNVNPNEYKKILGNFQANSGNVFSTQNINQTSTSPQVMPDDLLGIRGQIQTQLGIPKLSETYQNLFGQLKKYDVATEEQSRKIGEQQLSMNVIRGQEATTRKIRASERLGLATEAEIAQSALQAAQVEAGAQFSIRESDVRNRQQMIIQYPGAGITFGDSTEQASSKIQKFQIEEEDRIRKQAKKDAFDEMYMSAFGTDRGKLSRREAAKKLKKRFNSDKEYENRMKEIEMAIAEKALAKPYYKADSGTGYDMGAAQKALIESKKGGENIDLNSYLDERQKFLSSDGNVGAFDAQFGGMLSEGDQVNLGLVELSKEKEYKITKWQRDSAIEQQLSTPEAQSLTDEEKAQYIRSQGGTPADFGLWGF